MRVHTMTPEALRHNTASNWKEIGLQGNNIGDAGAMALAEASEQMPIIYIFECLCVLVFT